MGDRILELGVAVYSQRLVYICTHIYHKSFNRSVSMGMTPCLPKLPTQTLGCSAQIDCITYGENYISGFFLANIFLFRLKLAYWFEAVLIHSVELLCMLSLRLAYSFSPTYV